MTEETPLPKKVNDALLVPWGHGIEIFRVIAYTEDGRAIVKGYGNILKVEDEPNQWAKVGVFKHQWIGNWKFYPYK